MESIAERVEALLSQMTPAEKAGQLTQFFYFKLPQGATSSPAFDLSAPADDGGGGLGRRAASASLLFVTDPAEINRLQRLAIEGNRLGIPLLFGFDVIHGLRTILPVPIAMAASWDPATIEQGQIGGRPRGARRRHPLDVRADGRHRPRSALGPDDRGRRRGSVPRSRGGRRPGSWLPGRRASARRSTSSRARSTSPGTAPRSAAATTTR